MNRHHYTLIARTIATARAQRKDTEVLTLRLADAFAATQPNFNRDKFLAGCFENLASVVNTDE